jgi:hypothetical protein
MVEDRYNRGTLTGRRTEIVTYIFKKSGTMELPAVAIKWWDLWNRELRETVLPPRAIEVSASDAGQNSPMAQSDVFAPKPRVYPATILAALMVLFGLLQNRLRPRWNAWRLKKWKNPRKFQRIMISSGFKPHEAHRVWIRMNKWQLVHRRAVSFVMTLKWFREQGHLWMETR